jgi:hypothetical protein
VSIREIEPLADRASHFFECVSPRVASSTGQPVSDGDVMDPSLMSDRVDAQWRASDLQLQGLENCAHASSFFPGTTILTAKALMLGANLLLFHAI